MLYPLVRSLLFRMDAEEAHEFTTRHLEALQQIPIALRTIRATFGPPVSPPAHLLGLTFPNAIGIAAGFDKNARLIPMLAALGFGFIEAGTVTLHPQPGNPRPRLFRVPASKALINRMGFNNEGADAIAARLQAWRTFGAPVSSPAPPIFVNIGKNRDVPLEAAAENYAACYERVAPHADAAVLNLSSPNTPGLRELQRPDQLENLIAAIDRRGPILVKIAPDLDDAQIAEIADVCRKRADGMICTNTMLTEGGGLSGAPLKEKATAVLAKVRARVGPDYPLIGVGGIFTADDVNERMAAGANLVQVYTAFIYEGPFVVRRLLQRSAR